MEYINKDQNVLNKKEEEELLELERLAKQEKENNLKKKIEKIKRKIKIEKELQIRTEKYSKKKIRMLMLIKKNKELKFKDDKNYIFYGQKINKDVPGPGAYNISKFIISGPRIRFGHGERIYFNPECYHSPAPNQYNIRRFPDDKYFKTRLNKNKKI